VLTERSIVLAWNPLSIALALDSAGAGTAGPDAPFGESGGLVVHLDRLPEADRRLQQLLERSGAPNLADPSAARPPTMPSMPKPKANYVWDQLRIDAANHDGRIELHVRLGSGGAS
jgi:hypothetical protein